METVLALRGISKHYPDHRAVADFSLDIRRGELHALLGPSGSGKTTTLRMIAGFEAPTAGTIHLDGRDITAAKPYERNVSTVFQNYALFPHMTVRGNVEFGLKRTNAAGMASRVREVLDLVQLTGKDSRLPAELSGGERQRVALARSLAPSPEVLLLDEPLSALDPNLRKQVRAELKALQRRVGTTFLMVTHDQEEALSMADRITVMNGGILEQTGTPEDVYLRPRSRFVADFLGAVNWINGVGVRREATRIAHERPNGGTRTVAATVEDSTFLGDCLHVSTRLVSGESLVAQVSRLDGPYRTGDAIHVWWHPHDELNLPQ